MPGPVSDISMITTAPSRRPVMRGSRLVVRVLGVRRTDDGVRYRVRALRGVLPARLAPANLMIDSVPITAISAAMQAYLTGNAAKVQPWEPIINALYFPMAATVMANGFTISLTMANRLVSTAAANAVLRVVIAAVS